MIIFYGMPIGRGMKVEIKKTSGYGLVRITEYEVGLINYLYLVSKAYQINSVKRKCEKSPDLDEENYAIK